MNNCIPAINCFRKRTLERLEAGDTTHTKTLLRVLRELDLLERLEVLLPEPKVRPAQAAKAEGEQVASLNLASTGRFRRESSTLPRC